MNNIEQLITDIERRLHDATIANDVKTTDELLADDWLNINANGSVSTKAQSLAIMTQFQFLSIVNEDVRYRVYPGIVVVTGRSERQLSGADGGIISSRVRFTRVYAQLAGQWRVITSQATPMAG